MKKLFSALLILSFLTASSVQAGWLQSMETTIIYETEVNIGVAIRGIPAGGSYQNNPVGYINECSFAFSSCDDDKQGVTMFADE